MPNGFTTDGKGHNMLSNKVSEVKAKSNLLSEDEQMAILSLQEPYRNEVDKTVTFHTRFAHHTNE